MAAFSSRVPVSLFYSKDLISTQNLTLRWYGVQRSNLLTTLDPNVIYIIVLPSRTIFSSCCDGQQFLRVYGKVLQHGEVTTFRTVG